MSASNFINEFNRVIRGLDASDVESLRHRELSCVEALQACSNNSKKSAKLALEPYEKRQLSEEAEWVYDDFLLFALLCCFVKFGEFKHFLCDLTSLRRRNEQGPRVLFLQDVERLARAEAFSAQSLFSVVVADFLQKDVADASVLNKAQKESIQLEHDMQMTAFEETIAKRCKEIVAELSMNSSMSSSIIVRNLWKRVRFVAMVAYLSFATIMTSALGWLSWLLLFGGDESSSLAGKILSLGLMGGVFLIWKFKDKCYGAISYFFVWILAGKPGLLAMRSFKQI